MKYYEQLTFTGKGDVEEAEETAIKLNEVGYRKRDIIERKTAKIIAKWIAFRAFHGGYAEPVQNVLSELSDVIKRYYGVEVEND